MSSPSSTAGTPSPSPSSSGASIKDPNSNLYLFTFLATLIILLVVSTFIIFRACYRRLRLRRNVHRAMEQGLVLAPPDSRGFKFVSPPKLYDVWLTDKHPSPSWANIIPISVQPVPATADEDLYLDGITNESKASLASSTSSSDTLQVSVLVAMPYSTLPASEDEDYFPEVALGFAQAPHPS
ncbi:hypothetical protein MSAN_01853000 [Mycena sanguinolenta]|uniref:Uncharacterized protein n=1 Tax=Mycena sanguinolenta TaxID=230812 RepID=A0A8H7CSW7_9AGAR|nr:hypothetical protein MSAN_01853000 [Mycena sanguinolenta]